ncbi:uncharacterized protein LOC100835534 isoform X1 [Brachypodium distachyon]|uniref:Uncharacterized protein n=1 Tax=Brachypodium distachyon TaxID=15368 RepID=I1HL64_BRADI|nr:uncharacterized protein LOC100835534 isoform X1 [Brachypodium distachyon]KQK07173.1 hypothetical protein BRADI_2g33550v3 [Brachypodium distachyon]|eukprot:XP_003568793.1 uncharacterized protein LOC100835534 isoform X1 [Brachypodium distachyon]
MSGGQEGAEGSDHAMDLVEDQNNLKTKRSRATNWPKVMSKFLLEWYLEKKKAMPPKSKFKKIHHHYCQSALNARFESAYTVDQVHRHLRRFKEVWSIVARYMNENGSRIDKKNRMLILPSATMSALPLAERAILVKPIPFFDHLQALFGDCPVDRASMTVPFTDADLSDDQLESQDPSNLMVDHADPDEAGLDKVVLEGEDDCHDVVIFNGAGTVPCEVMSGTSAPSAEPSGSYAESTMAALKPSLKKCKIVSKAKASPKPQAPVPHHSRTTDVLNSNLIGIHGSVAKPIWTASTSLDPNAPLWSMLKEIPLTPADRLSVGIHLCKPESEVHRSFFLSMGKEYLEAWAQKFLAGGEPGAL